MLISADAQHAQGVLGFPCARQARQRDEGQPELYQVTVIDLFKVQRSKVRRYLFPWVVGFFSSRLLRLGLVPSVPWTPTFVFTMATLDFYRVSHARCPQFSIYAFTKTLADLHGFLFVRPCINTSPSPSTSTSTYVDVRNFNGFYDAGGDDGPGRRMSAGMIAMQVTGITCRARKSMSGRAPSGQYLPSDDNGAENPCKERWKNMLNDVTAKMWGIFDETAGSCLNILWLWSSTSSSISEP
ncbi:hypothetical protein FB45DRAFT_1037228 [Roridomyces roridus]|uniref:Uncharacterized protein n=1 Tax=Roridomyces roridus TaxID=1738132 RepID=A0AAD7B7P2_9AGAR|nr:hypothetical protein FB45DRAFT_1037228 [Roridomyces roridus]